MMRNPRRLCISGLLLLSLVAAPALAQEPAPSTAGLIAFIAYQDTNEDGIIEPVADNGSLWVIDSACAAQPEGCGALTSVLTSADTDERDPAWSPDGTRLAYSSATDLDGNGIIDMRDFLNLYTFTLADGTVTRVTNSFTLDEKASWSPDGLRLTFQSTADTNGDGFVTFSDLPAVNVINSGGGERALVAFGAYSISPAWSPDGASLAFVTFAEDAPQGIYTTSLFLINPDGGGRVQLTGADRMDQLPVWSPDGTRIAFVSTTDTTGDGLLDMLRDDSNLTVINRDGTGLLTLARCDPFAEALAWSPDGTRIAYTYNGSLYTVESDNPGATLQLTGAGYEAESPAWSPDGSRLAFTSNGRLYVIPASGGTPVPLTPEDVVVRQPTWSPVTAGAAPEATGEAMEEATEEATAPAGEGEATGPAILPPDNVPASEAEGASEEGG